MSRAPSALKGLASLTAAITNAVQASEMLDDVLGGRDYFRGPLWLRWALLAALLWLTVEETAKARARVQEVT